MADKLDYITIKGFRSIRGVEKLPIKPINVLIGANGSGKSNFIGAFGFLHAIREGLLDSYTGRQGGADKLLHFGSKATRVINLEMSFNDGTNGYELVLAPTVEDSFQVAWEWVWYWDKKKHENLLRHTVPRHQGGPGISNPFARGIAHYIRRQLAGVRVYHFHDTGENSPIKKTQKVADNRFLQPDGANLAPYLRHLRKKHPGSYALILRAIQTVAPFLRDFELEPSRDNARTMRLEWKHRNSERYFDVASLSDGTLRFICLATLLLQPKELRPPTVLIDEPELGLHPHAITTLAALVKSASADSQVILSTQSPTLVDHFEPDDVLVVDLVEGATKIHRLSPEKLKRWLRRYSLGQLWEKNHFGGRPGTA